MIPTETKLLPQEAIEFVDRLLAQHILLTKLCQIPEFIQLWRRAQGSMPQMLGAVMPVLTFYHLGKMVLSNGIASIRPDGLFDRAQVWSLLSRTNGFVLLNWSCGFRNKSF